MESILDLAFQLYRAAQDLPIEDFEALAFSILKVLVPFCAAIWFAAEYERGRVKALRSCRHGAPPEALEIIAAPTGSIRDTVRPAAETSRLIYCTPASGSWLVLYRRELDPEFAEEDRRTLALFTPHLAQAQAINRRLHVASESGMALEPVGSRSVIRADGSVHRSWERLKHVKKAAPPVDRLTPREYQIAQLFGAGASYKEIAREASIAPATVRNVVQNAYRKLKINNKAQLARLMADAYRAA